MRKDLNFLSRQREPAYTTLKKFEYVGSAEYPDGIYNGHDLRRADMETIWAVGRTPLDAVKALCKGRLGKFGGKLNPLNGGDPRYTWGFQFTADGTSCKAAGVHVPGGVILTWWK